MTLGPPRSSRRSISRAPKAFASKASGLFLAERGEPCLLSTCIPLLTCICEGVARHFLFQMHLNSRDTISSATGKGDEEEAQLWNLTYGVRGGREA